MDHQSCIHFAIEASRRLQEHSLACNSAKPSAFSGQLASLSYNVCRALEQFADKPVAEQKQGLRHVQQYLENINRVYQWPKPSATISRAVSFDRKHYPNIVKALAQVPRSGTCIDALKSFAVATDSRGAILFQRKTLLKSIERFLQSISSGTQGGVELTDVAPPEQRQKDEHDYQAYIRTLYDTLSSHCQCQAEGGTDPITANLRLNSCCVPNDVDNSVSFRLLFLDHPHRNLSGNSSQWQDAVVRVHKRRGVKFKKAEPKACPTRDKTIPSGGLCQLITKRAQSQLVFAVSDQGLVLERPAPLSRRYILRSPSISLSSLLEATLLDTKSRLLLSYILAKAVWQFYDSKWMRQEWNKDALHFMFEKTSTVPKAVLVNEPFLYHDFGKDTRPPEDDAMRVHQFPKILALGIILLEIEFGIDLKDKRSADCVNDDGSPTINADLTTAIEVFNNDLQAKTEPTSFDQHQGDAESIREALWTGVVRPIENIYMIAWDQHPDETQVQPLDLEVLVGYCASRGPSLPMTPEPHLALPVASNHAFPNHWPQSTFTVNQSINLPLIYRGHSPQLHGTMSAESGFSSEHWFHHLSPLNNVLRAKPKDQDGQWRKSRIAVLDTGVSEDLADSEDWVRGYKDFVSGDDDTWQDSTGHGTNAIRLIKTVYNMADIYVARVFAGREACDTTHVLMAEAMQHAIREWKADVIAMPSGFPSHHEDIRAAVDATNANHVLIFTAAANYGNVTDVAFPGRLYRDAKLFCMFSTDANARCLHNLNPSPLAGAWYSFAVLGENIQLPGMQGPLLSGTSYSAVIGAALAGRILDFSRQPLARQEMRGVAELSRVEGMSAVFARMARGAVDNGYHCITPWKIMPQNLGHVDGGAKGKEAQRAYICETISRALEDMYSH
ncbi:hypothetical protein PG984_011961 [Apiospora sp. TS-2023a]